MVTPELIDKLDAVLAPLPKVNDPTVVVTFPVTVELDVIITLSLEAGTPEGVQLLAEFQLTAPVFEVLVV